MFTTEVITTVKFTIRHIDKMTSDEFMEEIVHKYLDFSHMLNSEDVPSVEGVEVISDVIENANLALEAEEYEW